MAGKYSGSGSRPNIHVNSLKKFEFNGDGNFHITNGNLKVASGNGIDFSATSNSGGSMTSELLDDYEEGTFTPVLNSHSNINNTSASGNSNYNGSGTYTKVGRLVTVNVDFTSLHSAARNHVLFKATGLPFTSSSSNKSTATIGYQRGLRFVYGGDVFDGESGRYFALFGHIGGNENVLNFNGSMHYAPYTGWPATHDSPNSMYLRITISYIVA